jgi:hypothetical protein
MKAQMRKPVPVKAKYGDEYKQQALELWHKSRRSAAKMGGAGCANAARRGWPVSNPGRKKRECISR